MRKLVLKILLYYFKNNICNYNINNDRLIKQALSVYDSGAFDFVLFQVIFNLWMIFFFQHFFLFHIILFLHLALTYKYYVFKFTITVLIGGHSECKKLKK